MGKTRERESQTKWMIDSSWRFKCADKNFRFRLTIMSKSKCVSITCQSIFICKFRGFECHLSLISVLIHKMEKIVQLSTCPYRVDLINVRAAKREAAKYVGSSLKIFGLINSATNCSHLWTASMPVKDTNKKVRCLKWVRWDEQKNITTTSREDFTDDYHSNGRKRSALSSAVPRFPVYQKMKKY